MVIYRDYKTANWLTVGIRQVHCIWNYWNWKVKYISTQIFWIVERKTVLLFCCDCHASKSLLLEWIPRWFNSFEYGESPDFAEAWKVLWNDLRSNSSVNYKKYKFITYFQSILSLDLYNWAWCLFSLATTNLVKEEVSCSLAKETNLLLWANFTVRSRWNKSQSNRNV